MKKIVVIGATSAIATACMRIWATEAAQFFLVARDSEKLQQTASDLSARGAKVVSTYCMDATDLATHPHMLEAGLAALKQIDIALVAHGTLPDQSACEQNVTLALSEFATNCTSFISLLTLLAQHMETQRCGTLAVISSVAGDRGRPSNCLYGTAKAAVSTYCEGLRARLFKAGAHVITIKPGFVDTPMTKGLPLPAMLVAKPEQVAVRIVKGIDSKVANLYVPSFWALIMLLIRNIPEPIFKRLSL
ncbi:short-chain dehydrogenase [Pseudomonas sp. MWU12-2534b]|nr:short-chain dehydrogenase [Pseudomonas sp. MWU12-2534b]